MKCNKCGEISKDSQAFCLKCGNPIRVVPDFNLIEAEIANSVGEIMKADSEKTSKETKKIDFKDIKEKSDAFEQNNINIENYDETIQLDFITRKEETKKEEIKVDIIKDNIIEEDDVEELIPQKNNRKKFVLITTAIVSIVIIAIISSLFIFGKEEKSGYDTFFNAGKKAINDEKYDIAIDRLLDAVKVSDNSKQELESRILLLEVFDKLKEESNRYEENLLELVKLDEKETSYYVYLATYYDNNGMVGKLGKFLKSIEDEKIILALDLFYPKPPVVSVESGSYNKAITILISTKTQSDNNKIYYTLDESTPTTASMLYQNPIEIKEEGKHILKTIIVNENSIESTVVTKEYEITFSAPEPPVITPNTGNYTQETMISIKTTEGNKIYYTFDNKTPTLESEEYKEEIKMPRGTSIIKAITVDENGLISSVSQEAFNLTLPRNYSIEESKDMMLSELLARGVINDLEGNSNNDTTIKIVYSKIVLVDNNEYYIYRVLSYDQYGNETYLYDAGIDTLNGSYSKFAISNDGIYSVES